MFIKQLTLILLTLLSISSVHGQSSNLNTVSNINTYDYIAMDDNIVIQTPNVDDVFAVGNNLSLTAPIFGTAHLVGKNIEISDDVNQAVYVIGEQVNVGGSITQSLYALASNLTLNETLGGDLRLVADNAYINGNIEGRMMAAIQNIYIDSIIEGDVMLTADNVSFGPNAKINGLVSLYLPDDATVEVPAYVASSDNVEIIISPDEHHRTKSTNHYLWHWIINPIVEILVLALLTLVLAKIASGWIQKVCTRSQSGWAKTSLKGLLSLVVLTGMAMLSLITLIGIPIALVVLIVMVILVSLGWLMCIYLLGNRVINKLGKDPEDSLGSLALSCVIGATLITLISLIPWLGWLFALLIAIYGVGCVTPYVLRLNKE